MNILDIKNLNIYIKKEGGYVNILQNFDISIKKNQIHAIVGGSGSGKSLIAKIILDIANPSWKITADRMCWKGINLLNLSSRERRSIINNDVSMIYQDPSSYLDPSMTIGQQLEKIYKKKSKKIFFFNKKEGISKIKRIMQKVGIKHQERIMESYAWELPEGICQKIMIALAIINEPTLLIADEPTSMMNQKTSNQIYKLMYNLNKTINISILMVTNDIKSIEHWTNCVSIMYLGQKIEYGDTQKILANPHHPYSYSLINSEIYIKENKEVHARDILKGNPPSLNHIPIGCRLGPRCPYAKRKCIEFPKFTKMKKQAYACHFPIEKNNNDDNYE